MKPWKDISKVPMPTRIQLLPKDERGYPIPYGVFWKDGVPDFRQIDHVKWVECTEKHLCGICGNKLDKNFCFVGGKLSIKNRLFTDSPMHIECAVYALQVCPFLAMPKFGYLNKQREDAAVYEFVSNEKPEVFGMGVTSKYSVIRIDNGYALHSGRFSRIVLWKDGKQVKDWSS